MSTKPSATKQLAIDIEKLTGGAWGPELRLEVEELIRQYRFNSVAEKLTKISKLVHASGDTALSEKIALGKV